MVADPSLARPHAAIRHLSSPALQATSNYPVINTYGRSLTPTVAHAGSGVSLIQTGPSIHPSLNAGPVPRLVSLRSSELLWLWGLGGGWECESIVILLGVSPKVLPVSCYSTWELSPGKNDALTRLTIGVAQHVCTIPAAFVDSQECMLRGRSYGCQFTHIFINIPRPVCRSANIMLKYGPGDSPRKLAMAWTPRCQWRRTTPLCVSRH